MYCNIINKNSENPDKVCEKVAKRIIIPNPKTGQLVTEAFKLYATGQYNTYELNQIMFEKGLVSNVGKKLAESVFVNLLKNRLYLGYTDKEYSSKKENMNL